MPTFIRTIALFIIGLSITAGANGQPLTLEEIVSLKRVSQVRLSPDGDRALYLLSVPRTPYEDDNGLPYQHLRLLDLASGNSTEFVAGDAEVLSAEFSASGESIYFLALRDEEDKFPGIWEIPLAGGEARKVYQHTNAIIAAVPSPDGKHIAFLAPDAPPAKAEELAAKGFAAVIYEESVQPVHVWLLDLETQSAERQELNGSASALVWAPDSKRYAVALASTPLVDDAFINKDIYVVNARSGQVENRLGSVGKSTQFAFSPNGQRVAYIGSVDIHDPREGRLYVVPTRGGDRVDLLPDFLGHVQHIGWQDDQTIEYLAARGLWTEVGTVAADSPRAAGPAPSGGPIVRTFDSRPGVDISVAIADTPEHPPEVYVWTQDSPPRRMTDSNPWLADRELATQEPFQYRAADELALEAVLLRPLKSSRGGAPLVLFIHGGPEAHDSMGWVTSYSRPAQLLAGQGYAVAYPNYRGSTGRGVEFSKLGQNDYADEEFSDIVDAKNALVAQGIADPDRVGISGGSYGGYATMWGATALTEHFAAGVAFVGISNQVSKFGTGDIPMEMYNMHSRAWPWEDWMWMLRRSPVYHAGKTRTPLLIMHGDKDPRVHPSQSLEMYRHIKLRTETPVRLVFYPDEGHGNRKTAAQLDYGMRLERWMNHYLKGPGGEAPPYEIDHAARLEAVGSEEE